MDVDSSKTLVIAISSTALFDLTDVEYANNSILDNSISPQVQEMKISQNHYHNGSAEIVDLLCYRSLHILNNGISYFD